MKQHKTIIILSFILITLVIPLVNQTPSTSIIIKQTSESRQNELRFSATITNTKEWLNNTGFDQPIDPWYAEIKGDSRDITSSEDNNEANFIVLGDEREFTAINGTPQASDWIPTPKPGFSIYPDRYTINQYGCNASHEYWEDAGSFNIYGVRGNQTRNRPSVLWRRVIEMPVDMNDYRITSANLTVIFNASANTNVETPNDNLNPPAANPTAAEYDHVKFYVQLSDLEDKVRYPAASYEPRNLGFGDLSAYDNGPNDGIEHNIPDTQLISVSEEVLVFYLNRILEYDSRNFTIFLGIDIDVEDNYTEFDRDTYYSLLIKTCNLTFTYKKIINEFTSLSWSQDGNKISSLSNYDVIVKDANLNFLYKVDKNWTSNTTSLNSEIRILINGNPHSESIKLTKANSTFQDAKVGGFDVTPLITDDVNVSIQVYLADEFRLGDNITISIDNASLLITYSIIQPDIVGSGGGGGGTKVIRGPDYTPLVIGLSVGIIALIAVFGLYQARYKHPPMVRKIRKLKKKIKKGKKLKSLIVIPREELIRIGFKNKTHQILDDEFLQSEKLKEIAKIPNNKKINKKLNKGEK